MALLPYVGRVLDLSGNWLSGTIPDSVGHLTSLQYVVCVGRATLCTCTVVVRALVACALHVDACRVWRADCTWMLVVCRGRTARGCLSCVASRGLDLSRNFFLTGTIPDCVGDLASLLCVNVAMAWPGVDGFHLHRCTSVHKGGYG